MNHILWWKGPDWLRSMLSDWPAQTELPCDDSESELAKMYHLTAVMTSKPLFPMDRVTAWTMRFINNCRPQRSNSQMPD